MRANRRQGDDFTAGAARRDASEDDDERAREDAGGGEFRQHRADAAHRQRASDSIYLGGIIWLEARSHFERCFTK